jgi:polyphosphate kinase
VDTPKDVSVADEDRLFNRELSWLAFNTRVLELAEDERTPLLERAKFLAIFSQNLDEFFQVRIAGLKEQVAAGYTRRTADGRTPAQQLLEIREALEPMLERLHRCFSASIVPALASERIVFCDHDDLDPDDQKYLEEEFEAQIFPVLTPLAVDPGHPFPYISDLSLNLAVVVRNPDTGDVRFARVKVPNLLARFIVLPDGERVVPLEQVIGAHLERLFPGMVIDQRVPFRVTRNADLALEDEEADDLLAAIEVELRRRRFGRAVRLEIDGSMTEEIRDLLVRELELESDDVYEQDGTLGLQGLWSLYGLDRPDLKDPPWVPITQYRLSEGDDDGTDMFAELRKGDILVHHPYSSFATSVEEFIRQASVDPRVLAIKLTLYRTSGDSSIIE